MSTIIRRSVIPGILNQMFTSDVNCHIDNRIRNNTFPQVDIIELQDAYVIKAEIPGIDKNELNIIIDKGVLKIEGERKEEYKTENGKFYHFERKQGKFSRSFALPEETDHDRIDAKMASGILELTIPKKEKAKPKSIEIKVA